MDPYETMKPHPPPMANKEILAIWAAWSDMEDRKVAREAAAKGTHVELVHLFLSARRKMDPLTTKQWFKEEVLIWVIELLQRKQISRSLHILKNANLEPHVELNKIFHETTDVDLRNYLGNYLMSVNNLNEKCSDAWTLLTLILLNEEILEKYHLEEINITCLDHKSEEWKSDIATDLFFRTFDPCLHPYISDKTIWKYLMETNNVNVVKYWIKLKYEGFTEWENEIDGNLIILLQKHPIPEEMLQQLLEHSAITAQMKHAILDELSKSGVFLNEELGNCQKLLQRLSDSGQLVDLYSILSKTTSTLSVEDFMKMLIEFCLEKKLYAVMSCCLSLKNFIVTDLTASIDSKHTKLLMSFSQLIQLYFTEELLRKNIYMVAEFLDDGGALSYFEKNPLVFLALLILIKEIDLIALVLNQKNYVINGLSINEHFHFIYNNFRTVRNVIEKNTFQKTIKYPTYYDLLRRHSRVNVNSMFKFQFDKLEVPHFNSMELAKFGYQKEVDHIFYLKQGRPTIASKVFILNQLQRSGCLSDDCANLAAKKVTKLALWNFKRDAIPTSCVAFLEIIGVDSKNLRIYLQVANVLSAATYDDNSIKLIFTQIESNPYELQSILDVILSDKIDFSGLNNAMEFGSALKTYDLVVKYSQINNIKLPEMFLRNSAYHNKWFQFMLFAQLKNYPLEQIKEVLHCFKSPNLVEHIHHCVVHDIQVTEENVLIGERDSRKYYLSKIGMRKSLDSLNLGDTMYSSTASHSTNDSDTTSTESDLLEIDILNTKATLLQILIHCHNSTDPPKALLQACQLYRNPLFAVFATSYEPDSVVINWLTWLAVSSDIYQTFTNFESLALCSTSVADLMVQVMVKEYPKTLLQSFQIFIPTNPLCYFLEFLLMGIEWNFDRNSMVFYLKLFRDGVKKLRRSSVLTAIDHEMSYFQNKVWIEETALLLLSAVLEYNINSLYKQIQFLRVIVDIDLEKYFIRKCPNFVDILTILKFLYDSKEKVKMDLTGVMSISDSREAIVKCIDSLVDNELYKVALNVAQVENLPVDRILIKEWEHKFNNRSEDEVTFWDKCNEVFVSFNVMADCVVDFYTRCMPMLTNSLEVYHHLLKLSHTWAEKFQLSCHYDLEQKMWLAYVNLEERHKVSIDLEIKSEFYLYKTCMEKLHDVSPYNGDLSMEFLLQFEKLIILALNKENFWLALKLEKMFKCQNSDLELLKLCHSLAESILMPYQLSAEQRMFLSRGGHFRRLSGSRRNLLTAKVSSFSSSPYSYSAASAPTFDPFDSPLQDTLVILQTLMDKLTNGQELANNIYMRYRISVNIEISYSIIALSGDYMKLLRSSLDDDCINKLEVVHDFMAIYKWTKDQISDFIREELVSAGCYYIRSKNEHFIMWDLNMDQDFHMILQLMHDGCSLLGHKLFAYAIALLEAQTVEGADIKISDTALIVELLIRAHDCFTADCNMEGISILLKKCQSLTSHLMSLRSWKLIVRLLTGVARYTEMTYIFHILRENDQFEFMLCKGSKKDNALKVALLDYLKKFCPDNHDLYQMVALHFALFSEVAFLWEREAQNLIINLIAISKLEMQNNKINVESQRFISLSNSDGTKFILNKAMENYTHATEFHLKGEKLAKAMNAAKQAELLALQLSLLKNLSNGETTTCVLSLNNGQITAAIMGPLNFEQALILTGAYKYQPDWASVLFERCIVQNNPEYLDDFVKKLPLTESLIHDISRKFLAANMNAAHEIANMTAILSRLASVHAKYRIGSELGFKDLVEDLINSGQLAYLKDTVWKRGYRS